MSGRLKREASKQERPIGAAVRLRQRGSGLVEQALVLTVLLMVMFGIIDFGRALYTYHFVSEAAREATRWASVRGSTCNPALTGCEADAANVQALVKDVAGMGLDPANITVDLDWATSPNSIPACTAPANHPGCAVQVQVTYAFQFILPFLPPAARTLTMSSTSQMVITQ
jgi:Flp pilus assembly protein TadG